MAVVLRFLFLIPIGFALACFAAACVVVFALIGGMRPIPWPGEIIMMATFATIAIGMLAAVPVLLAAILAETWGLRSLFYWLAVGGALAAIVVVTPMLTDQMRTVGFWLVVMAWMPDAQTAEGWEPVNLTTIIFAAAFVGAFVYWLIAGRLAGYRDVISPG